MKDAIKAAFKQRTLFQHGASVALHSGVCQQVGGRWKQIGNVQLNDFFAIEFAFFQNFTGQACA